ncbi:hypothetical protein [Terasakiella sp. SH-1]|uniref:hypothetical protein n=1 Tax=Terasakiella sp. SH-1 TaxID=2560057 RepID=UPI0010737205|nr:hypothetical protein [Terasakiella sp. SH-1]
MEPYHFDAIEEILVGHYAKLDQELCEVYSVEEADIQGVDNECRSALTHIARIMDLKTPDEVKKEQVRAAGHLERARRDALKHKTYWWVDLIQKLVRRTMESGVMIPKPHLKELEKLRRKHFMILRNEVLTANNKTDDEIALEYEDLCTKLSSIYERLDSYATLAGVCDPAES